MLQEALIEIVPLKSMKMGITPRPTHLRLSHSLHRRPSSGSAYIQLVSRRNTWQERAPVNKWLCDPDYLAQYGLPFKIEHLIICKCVHHSKASTFEQVDVTARPV